MLASYHYAPAIATVPLHFDAVGYPIIYHPRNGHIMGHDEIDFYRYTSPEFMTLEQLNFFKDIGKKIKSTATKASDAMKKTAKKTAAGGKKFWNKEKYNIKKGINIADKVTGVVDTVAGMGGAAVCGPYAGACKAGAMGAHLATSTANMAAKKFIKMQMLRVQYEAEQRAAMGMIY